ncbi:MAG TPA: hypothetical protein DCZ94_11000 [Lentisphaeria bacterium]|nr:MAG: hypothetical protein A2X48_06880 [Lentisphaerae bacterium GWF2_49_21]HBC87472.1 hypothetical protein [Lentisphaeria bacterium]
MEDKQDAVAGRNNVFKMLMLFLGLIFVLAIIFFLFVYFVYGSYMNGLKTKLDAKLKVLREAGYPVTLSELDSWYTAVKDEDNAVLVYQRGFDSFIEIGKCDFAGKVPELAGKKAEDGAWEPMKNIPIAGTCRTPVPPDMLSERERKMSAIYLETNKESLQFFKMAAKMEKCRFKIDLKEGYMIFLPHLSRLRNGVRLLALESLLASEKGDLETCLEDIEYIFGIARSLDREPVLISFLVRNACNAIAINAVENLLSRVELDEAQLQRIMNAIQNTENPYGLNRALAGENVFFIDMDWSKFWASEVLSGEGSSAGTSALIKFQKISGISMKSKIIWMEFITPAMEDSKKPFPKALKDTAVNDNAFYERAGKERSSLSPYDKLAFIPVGMMMPGLSTAISKKAQILAMHRAAMTALAIERYRLKNRALPESLDMLVPEFLPVLPQDPFTGGNFQYKKGGYDYFLQKDAEYPGMEKKNIVLHKVKSFGEKADSYEKEACFLRRNGYMIYSLGGNLTDEGGFPDNSTGDIPFRIAR